MSEEEKMTVEEFMNLEEVSGPSGTTHVISHVAESILDFAKSMDYNPFRVEDWIESAISSGIISDDDRKDYASLKLYGDYRVGKGARKGQTAYYSGNKIFTAIKKTARVYLALRGAVLLIIPEDQFTERSKALKGAKGKALIKNMKNNFAFMYDRANWKAPT
jgi:hypothetical protein